MSRFPKTLSGSLCALFAGVLVAAPPAPAATRLVIKGAGFGHGVGMSQYGAYGFALKGKNYRDILAHYYTGTKLGALTSNPDVTVLLRSSRAAAFTGASRIGDRRLSPGKRYSVAEKAGNVVLRSPTGRALVAFTGPVRISGANAPIRLLGKGPNGVRDGLFRGALEFRPSGGGLLVINALDLDSYLRGVVAAESPASWPQNALRAQAVAARTYALTTSAGGNQGFSQWADTRSQVYNGVSAETPSTDTAVAATSRQIVTYLGKPIVAYFFSTSGGKTENVENGFPGASPRPYLKGVVDPYDDASPKHRWGPYRYTLRQAERKLGGLVKGRLRRIKVTERGFSPRIVSARVIGTRGVTVVNGPMLRKRFDLFDSWATFTTIGAKVTTPKATPAAARSRAAPAGGPAADTGRSLRAAALSAAAPSPAEPYGKVLSGHVAGAQDGDWIRVQRKTRAGWREAFWTTAAGAHGRYRATLPGPGTYRVKWRGLVGPHVTAR
ncbi:MAG: SpoIID/LytB domain-containing protein [Actinomycetota bacterium]|nr:SpoIID/LytB domain-containing protein [Actinomycetota bacterium]